MDYNMLVKMVNVRGRVMLVHGWEVENLRQQGAKRVPWDTKEEYLPQYDTSIVKKEDIPEDLDTIEASNTLECEEIL